MAPGRAPAATVTLLSVVSSRDGVPAEVPRSAGIDILKATLRRVPSVAKVLDYNANDRPVADLILLFERYARVMQLRTGHRDARSTSTAPATPSKHAQLGLTKLTTDL